MLGAQASNACYTASTRSTTATLAATSLLMLLVGAAASWIPAYRASSVDPAKTLSQN